MTEEGTSRRGRRSHTNAAVVLPAIMICLAVIRSARYVVCTQNRLGNPPPQLEPEAYVQSGTLNDPAGGKVVLDALVTGGMLTFSINATLNVENGKGMTSLMTESPPDNGNHFIIIIIRGDTGEGLFRSDYLDPERYVEEVPLDVELKAGEYACVANPNAYHIQDSAYIGRGAACITLYVEGRPGI